MRRTPGLMSVACLLVVGGRGPGAAAPRAGGISPRNPQASPARHVAPEQLRLRRNPPRAEARRTGTRAGRVREGLRELSRPAGRENRWERLIAENGRPRPAAELAKVDRDRQRQAEALARLLTEQPAKERARQERDLAEQRREFEAIVDDIFIVFDIDMRGREAIEGHDTIALSLTPRPKAKPRTHQGRQLQKFALRAWINESDHELVRLDAEAIDTLSMGFGVLARLHKGSQLSFLRRRVNNEVWLPAAVHFRGGVRVALVRTLRRSGSSEFSGYRKFSVDTATTYQPPKTP